MSIDAMGMPYKYCNPTFILSNPQLNTITAQHDLKAD